MSEAWYCKAFGQELGPMSVADLLELVERSDVLPTDEVKCGDHGAWRAAGQDPRLFPQSANVQVRASAAAGRAESEALVGASPAAETRTGPIAAATVAAPGADLPEAIEAQHGSPEQPAAADASRARKPSIGPLNRKRILACAAVLAICGAAAGAGARILFGAGRASPRAAPSGGIAVEQQKIAALKQQIDDLMRQREELASTGGASAPEQPPSTPPQPAAPSGPESPSKSEQSSPADASSNSPAPADAVPPAPAAPSSKQAPEATTPQRQPPAADSPKTPTSVEQQGDANDKDPRTMSAAAQSSNQAANKQPANYPPAAKPVGGAVSSAGPAKTTQNGASPTSLILQTQKRRQQRLELLREIYEQARDCWSNMPNSKLRSKAWSPPSLRRKPPMRKSMPPAPPCWRKSASRKPGSYAMPR